MTNTDWIRAMNDEELCQFLLCDSEISCGARIGKPPFCDNGECKCEECISDWLKEEATP